MALETQTWYRFYSPVCSPICSYSITDRNSNLLSGLQLRVPLLFLTRIWCPCAFPSIIWRPAKAACYFQSWIVAHATEALRFRLDSSLPHWFVLALQWWLTLSTSNHHSWRTYLTDRNHRATASQLRVSFSQLVRRIWQIGFCINPEFLQETSKLLARFLLQVVFFQF